MKEWYKEMFEGNLVKYWLSISDSRKEVTNVQVSFLRDILKKGLVLDLSEKKTLTRLGREGSSF